MSQYNSKDIEPKWQKYWEEQKTFRANEKTEKEKFYILDMFPYPSGAGLHVGHPEGYTATDIVARFERMRGKEVLHPMGWDAFGLPAENFALKTGTHPRITTTQNIENFTRQIKSLGFSYDWGREIDTTDPEYFKWTQWIFLQLFESYFDEEKKMARPISELIEKLEANGTFAEKTKREKSEILKNYRLAYESEMPINFCPNCKTGLANEEVIDGKHDRCGTEIVRKNLRQWVLRITKYADRLLDDLETLTEWPEKIIAMQRNWIGKSTGTEVDFALENSDKKITVFTTRLDTIFSGTFLVLAPEHPLVSELTLPEQKKAVEEYLTETAKKSDLERTDLAKDKTGVFTGSFAINPANGEKMPIWTADFVLAHYGTGAVFADAHDERDFEMAKKFGIPLAISIVPEKATAEEIAKIQNLEECFPEKGILVNSAQFDGMKSDESIPKIREWLAEKGSARATVNFKFRDWIFSRQRYWGEPIPIIHCEECGAVANSSEFAQYYSEAQKKEACQRVISRVTANASSSENILASSAKKVKWVNKKISFSVLESPSKKGKVRISFQNLHQHFSKKSRQERAFRWKLFPTVFSALPDLDFFECQSKQVGFFRSKNHFFCVVVQNGELITFYHSQKISGTLKKLRENFSLPLRLPEVERYEPSGTGESPLATIPEFVNCTCPECGKPAKRETNTMPQWAGSSWYYLRFMDAKNPNAFCGSEKEKYWAPVDLYVGGAEHAVLHLLYSRFWHKLLFDRGFVSTIEPFQKLMNQGLILAEDGQKMSKSLGNVVNPDEIVGKYGADTLRMYEMFMGPFEQNKAWSSGAVGGTHRFLAKVWMLFSEKEIRENAEMPEEFLRLTHKTIKKITEDIQNFKFNTAISQMMIWTNAAQKLDHLPKSAAVSFCKLLSPFAPHLAEEIWHEILGNEKTIAFESWENYDENLARDEEIQLAIQVNGKLRATIPVAVNIEKEAAFELARNHENVMKFTDGKTIVKEIFVPGKIVNFVVK